MSPPPHRRHLLELDGLRAVAILLVLLTHFWTYPSTTPEVNRFAASGWMGVDLFFVLSGYLITGILWDARTSPHYYRNFYGRRVLRIFPLYYALLLVVFLVLPFHGSTPALSAVTHDRWLYVFYLANVALAWHGWRLFALDITWSLAIEEQFYLCWPVVLRRWSWSTVRRILIVLILGAPVLRTVALALGANWRGTLMLTPFRLDTMAVGALLALTERESPGAFDRLHRIAPWVAGLFGSGILVLIAGGWFTRDSFLVGSLGYSLLAVCFGSLLLLALRPPGPFGAALRLGRLRRIGTVSYGIYILHPLCYIAGATALARLGVTLGTGTSWIDGVAHLCTFSVLAYLVAEISFRFFETPLLRLKRHFEDRPLALHASEREQALPLQTREEGVPAVHSLENVLPR